MNAGMSSRLISDVVSILVKYDHDEIRQVLKLLRDPERIADLADLIDSALTAAKPRRDKLKRELRNSHSPSDIFASVKAARPADAETIDHIVGRLSPKWPVGRMRVLSEILRSEDLGPIDGEKIEERRSQFAGIAEKASPSLLRKIADALQPEPRVTRETRTSGSLQEWSDIILRDRKPRS